MAEQTYALAKSGVYGQANGAYADALSAIPDSGMFQSPIYQFWAGEADESDGTSGFGFPEVLAGLSDASASGGPIYREDQAGFAAGEYDGVDDGHDFTPDADLPTGDDPWSFAALAYIRDGSGTNGIVGWGASGADDQSMLLRVNGGDAEQIVWGTAVTGDPVPTGEWITLGGTYDGSTMEVLSQGSLDNSTSISGLNIQDQDHALAYRPSNNDAFLDGFLSEVIVSDVAETESAFSDFHNDRLG